MIKWILAIILMSTLCMGVEIEYSTDNATWKNVTYLNMTDMEALQVGLDEGTLYYFRATNDSENYTYLSQRTETSGERQMASLAIVAFITGLAFFMMFLSRIVNPLSRNPWIEQALKGGTITLGIYLLSMAVSIVASMSELFGFGLERQILSLLILTGWGGYLAMGITVLLFGYRAMQAWNTKEYNRRYGSDDENDMAEDRH